MPTSNSSRSGTQSWRWLAVIGPGLMVAATGVGAGDLATGAFTGSRLGVAILWAVVLGSFLKFVLNEGLARYQLATGQTLLEGAVQRLGRAVKYVFLPYLILWSFFVGSALMSACGVAAHSMFPIFKDPVQGKNVFGVIHSVVAVILVTRGGFRIFEKLMSICIAMMFVTVVLTAVLVRPNAAQVLSGLVWPTIPDFQRDGLAWTMALMGGVGGTLTVLCYGYWIREKGRTGPEHLHTCRIDLAVAYAATALFGIAMVILGNTIKVEAKGVNLIVSLANRLEEPLGPAGRWIFLIGAWGALFSSLLGVWQAVPYIFADFWRLTRRRQKQQHEPSGPLRIDTTSGPYRLYLTFIAIVPMLGLFHAAGFEKLQMIYAIVGAWFMPILAIALLFLNGRPAWVGRDMRNRLGTSMILIATLAFFTWTATATARKKWTQLQSPPTVSQSPQIQGNNGHKPQTKHSLNNDRSDAGAGPRP